MRIPFLLSQSVILLFTVAFSPAFAADSSDAGSKTRAKPRMTRQQREEEEGYYGSIKRAVEVSKIYYTEPEEKKTTGSEPQVAPESAQAPAAALLATAASPNLTAPVIADNKNLSESELEAKLRIKNPWKNKTPLVYKMSNEEAALRTFEQGKDFFRQRAYHGAEECFEEVIGREPRSQEAHYWLGLAREQLRDNEGAHAAFQIAFQLNPFSDIGKESRTKMMTQCEYRTVHAMPPVDPDWMMQNALTKISDQSHSAISARLTDGQRTAAWRIKLGNIEARRIIAETNRYLYGVEPETGWDNFHQYLDWNSASEISNIAQIQTHYVLSDARTQAFKARQDATLRANNLQDSANNLYRLLAEPYRPGRPHLRAFGTNLYVRYYGDERWDSRGMPGQDPPVHAMALRNLR